MVPRLVLHKVRNCACGELENGTPVDGNACAVRLKQLIALNVHDQLQMLLEETAQRELLLKGIHAGVIIRPVLIAVLLCRIDTKDPL